MKLAFDVYPVVNGAGVVKFAWQKSVGNYLAITGSNKVVNIYNRHGEHKVDVLIVLPGLCTSLDWDKDGDALAVAQDMNGILFLWNSHNFEVSRLDTGMKEPLTLCLWARHSHLLAVGTSKGNLLLYNHRTRRKIPILGKHTKRITCGCWSSQNLLALGSEDKTLSISNAEGDTLRQSTFQSEPYDIQFYHLKTDSKSSEETTVSLVIGHKTLFLYDMDNADNPVELAFQPRYGEIVAYKWPSETSYGEGNLIIGFSNGFFVVVSTHKNEIGQELYQIRNHKNFLSDVTLSNTLNQAASCGDNCVKIHDLSDLNDTYHILNVEEERGTLHQVQWTDDGQLLTVSTLNGGVFTYLSKLPMLGESCGTRLAYLTALLEVTIVNNVEEEPPQKIDVSVEPSFIALGPFHLAVGMNDRAWFHDLSSQGEVTEHTYMGTVSSVKLNGYYAAALLEGRIKLHTIDSSVDMLKDSYSESSEAQRERESRWFPDEGRSEVITCLSLTQDFLVYATEAGNVVYFYLEEWQYVSEYKHVVGISKVYPEGSGIRAVLVDDKSDAFLYNPVADSVVELAGFPPGAKGVLWETWPLDKHVFVAFDEENVFTYVYYKDTLNGPACEFVGVTKLPFGHRPLMLYNGEVSCQTLTGKISIMRLQTHIFSDDQGISEDELRASMQRCIVLKRFKDAWSLATALDSPDCWKELAQAALMHIDIETAIRAYQQVKNIGMVYSLQQIQHCEDRNLVVGHLAMFLGDFSHAQELFLASSSPTAALEMRRDLLHWEPALNLAKTLAPDQMPFISREYAQQLEFTGDYANALLHYERGVTKSPEAAEHDAVCRGGVARMAIHTGDIRRGVSIAQSMPGKELKKSCAAILEGLKLYAEAGVLYEKAQCWDKAASVYIKTKNWGKVGELFGHVTSPRLQGQYAKAREADGHFREAAAAYEAARDHNNAIRVYLDHLRSPDEAVRIVKESKSTEGAKMVAKFFQKLGDIASALQFLVISQCQDEAYAMAESHNQMEQYAEAVGSEATAEDYLRIASHFQRTGDHFKAGLFFHRAQDHRNALFHFLHCPSALYPEGENIDMAIATVGEAKQDSLTQQLIDYLMGESDDVPKDAKYLFRLYLALEQFREAAKTALLIAREDQVAGNYRNAHDVLFYMYSELNKHDIKIPAEMVQSLMILHSYILVKLHVKRGEHLKGARMLIRVANNISKFPSHIVPILTSTVIECHRSGLRGSAFSYAAMLMRPEYRQNIDPKWKKKIEQIVRKPDKSEAEELLEACPYCSLPLEQSKLDCPQCKNNIPYCIVTGRHLVKDDWTKCPECDFPALYSEFKSLLESATEALCPMCSNTVRPEDLKLVQEDSVTITN